MAVKILPADVADAFVKQYYYILNKCPENVHRFYQEPSLLGWAESDGVMTPVTTLSGINDKVMSSDYKSCLAEVKTIDAQESMEGGIIVVVTGCLTSEDNVERNFTQTFFLARQERGFFVLNDVLRFFDAYEPITEKAATDDGVNDQPTPTENSVPCNNSDSPTLETRSTTENGKVDEASDLSISKDTPENGAASTTSVASGESKFEVVAPATKPRSLSVTPKNPRVPSVVAPTAVCSNRISYASILAKVTPATSPRSVAVTPQARKQTGASPTTKASAPLVDGLPKVSTPTDGASKGLASSSKVAPKSPRGSPGAPNASSYGEANKGIYIGGLPYSITKQGIVDVVKQFGSVRRYSDTVQIRRHDDGFCCGFVEFESADAARRAVEAHHVMFGDKEAYITYKRSNRGNDGGARSPTRGGGQRNSNFRGRENEEWTREARGGRQRSSSDQWSRQASRDRVK